MNVLLKRLIEIELMIREHTWEKAELELKKEVQPLDFDERVKLKQLNSVLVFLRENKEYYREAAGDESDRLAEVRKRTMATD